MLKSKIKKYFKKIAVEWECGIYTTGTPLDFTADGSLAVETIVYIKRLQFPLCLMYTTWHLALTPLACPFCFCKTT